MQQDRYCRNCGQELKTEDLFCAGCGRPLHTTAHVPTPEAEVPEVPVPPTVSPPQEQQTSEAQDTTEGPRWKLLAVFLGFGIVETVQEMPPASPGESVASRLGLGVGAALFDLVSFVVTILFLGGIYCVVFCKQGTTTTFREVISSWPFVILAAGIAVLFLLG